MDESLSKQRKQYRKGLVLGLTMAEIVILIIFCLILLLSFIFREGLGKKDAEIKDIKEANIILEKQLEYALPTPGERQRFFDLYNDMEAYKAKGENSDRLREKLGDSEKNVDTLVKEASFLIGKIRKNKNPSDNDSSSKSRPLTEEELESFLLSRNTAEDPGTPKMPNDETKNPQKTGGASGRSKNQLHTNSAHPNKDIDMGKDAAQIGEKDLRNILYANGYPLDLEKLREKIKREEEQKNALVDQVAYLTSAAKAPNKFDDFFKELVLAKKKANDADDMKKRLESLAEKEKSIKEIDDALPGILNKEKALAARLADLSKEIVSVENIKRTLNKYDLPDDPNELKRMMNQKGDTLHQASENKRMKSEMEDLRAQKEELLQKLGKYGKGTEMPSCWYDSNGKPEYIFDVALSTDYFVIRNRNLPHRESDKLELPINKIPYDKEIRPSEFLSQTLPLYQWSVDKKCRFFVRAFDLTRTYEKDIYKRHIRELEMRFYKLEIFSEKFN